MKYTKKQIEKGFLKWEKDTRLKPSTFSTDAEAKEIDLEDMSKLHTETLIEYINK